MIYYSKDVIQSWQPNLMMLDLEDDLGHIYLSRNTYDQAVLVADRFNYDPELVQQKLGCEVQQGDVVDYMKAILPTPINVLAPFYNLIDSDVELDIDNMKQVIGVLSYMSMSIDFNTMLKVPFEVRANLVFTKSILIEYQGHFENFNFKIVSNAGHIIHEREVVSEIPRESKEDFLLEEKEEEIDYNNFLEDIGWDDIKIPSLHDYEGEEKEEVKEETVTEEESAEDAYSKIIRDFS